MLAGKVRRMLVRPIQSADLAFVVAGFLDRQDLSASALGAQVADHSTDLATLYGRLGETQEVPGGTTDPAPFLSRLRWDSAAIEAFLRPMTLFSLRAENLKASLDEAIADRQNTFLERFARRADTIAEIREIYPPTVTASSKLGRLAAVAAAADQRHNEILAAYRDANRLGAVRASITTTEGLTDSSGRALSSTSSRSHSEARSDTRAANSSSTTDSSTQLTTSNSTARTTSQLFGMLVRPVEVTVNQNVTRDSHGLPEDIPPHNGDAGTPAVFKPAEKHENPPVLNIPQAYASGDSPNTVWQDIHGAVPDAQVVGSTATARGTSEGNAVTSGTTVASGTTVTNDSSDSQATTSTDGTAHTTQSSTTLLDEFRHPSAENEIRFQRARLDLQDEVLRHSTFAKSVPNLETLYDNQIRMLDLRVRQLQLALINTYLVSPIAGFVTSAYKDKGESVAPGEPVLRVENHAEILVVGQVQVRGLVQLNDPVSINITGLFEGGSGTVLPGRVVSVRGHDSDNDEWELILRCRNTPAGASSPFFLPINYSFDYNDVALTIGA